MHKYVIITYTPTHAHNYYCYCKRISSKISDLLDARLEVIAMHPCTEHEHTVQMLQTIANNVQQAIVIHSKWKINSLNINNKKRSEKSRELKRIPNKMKCFRSESLVAVYFRCASEKYCKKNTIGRRRMRERDEKGIAIQP